MSNRLLISITNLVEWLNKGTKDFYEEVVYFLEQAIVTLQPAVESLRGKDINYTEKVSRYNVKTIELFTVISCVTLSVYGVSLLYFTLANARLYHFDY